MGMLGLDCKEERALGCGGNRILMASMGEGAALRTAFGGEAGKDGFWAVD